MMRSLDLRRLRRSVRRVETARTLDEARRGLVELPLATVSLLKAIRLRVLSDEPGPYHPWLRRMFSIATSVSGGDAEVEAEYAHYLNVNGQNELAREHFLKAEARASSTLEDVLASLAELEADEGRLAEARAVIRRAQRAFPSSRRVRDAAEHVRASHER